MKKNSGDSYLISNLSKTNRRRDVQMVRCSLLKHNAEQMLGLWAFNRGQPFRGVRAWMLILGAICMLVVDFVYERDFGEERRLVVIPTRASAMPTPRFMTLDSWCGNIEHRHRHRLSVSGTTVRFGSLTTCPRRC